MGYCNPFLQYGIERLASDANKAGIKGFIVPDLPLEEACDFRLALQSRAMDLIALVGPNTSLQRMQAYAEKATGYVYVTSILGTTGEQEDLPVKASITIERARKAFNLPIALGFGLQNAAQVEAMPIKPDAAIFGSALIKHLENGGHAADFMKRWQWKDGL
jgi:tryptophan synthase alpha chain